MGDAGAEVGVERVLCDAGGERGGGGAYKDECGGRAVFQLFGGVAGSGALPAGEEQNDPYERGAREECERAGGAGECGEGDARGAERRHTREVFQGGFSRPRCVQFAFVPAGYA